MSNETLPRSGTKIPRTQKKYRLVIPPSEKLPFSEVNIVTTPEGVVFRAHYSRRPMELPWLEIFKYARKHPQQFTLDLPGIAAADPAPVADPAPAAERGGVL